MAQSDGRLPNRMETDRLILRPYSEDDAAWYYAMSLRNRDHLRRYESGNVAMSLKSEAHTRETLAALATYWTDAVCYFVGVFDKSTDEFVAQLYVGPFSTDPVDYIIGYMADCAHGGRGVVSEALTAIVASIFENLGADQVRIHCDETNGRSRRVAERCGFSLDKIFPEEKQEPDGTLHMCSTTSYVRVRPDNTKQGLCSDLSQALS